MNIHFESVKGILTKCSVVNSMNAEGLKRKGKKVKCGAMIAKECEGRGSCRSVVPHHTSTCSAVERQLE